MRTVVSRRHGGIDHRLLTHLGERLVCVCDDPVPERLEGIWWGLSLFQCGRCGRKYVS